MTTSCAATGATPRWFLDQADGTWGTIASTATLDAVKPNPLPVAVFAAFSSGSHNGVTNAWVGASVDQRRREYLLTANGGHADYAGNEVYALSLGAGTPGWRRLTDPTPNAQMGFNTTGATSVWSDGRPKSTHNTFQEFGNGKVWMPQMNSVTGDGSGFNRVIAFNRDDPALLAADGTRATGGTGAPLPWTSANIGPWELYSPVQGFVGINPIYGFGRSVYNPRDGYVYAFSGFSANNTVSWRVQTTGPTTGTASTAHFASLPIGHFSTWCVMVPDVGPAGVVVMGCSLRQQICVFDCSKSGQSGAWATVTASGMPWFAPDHFGGSDGVYLSQFRQLAIGDPAFLNGRIYKLQIPAATTVAAFLAGSWQWSNFLPGGAVPTAFAPGSNASGAFGKWKLIENMGNGQSAIVYVGKVLGPTYVYKVPLSGLP